MDDRKQFFGKFRRKRLPRQIREEQESWRGDSRV